jgi:hypothetical protein
LVSIVDLRAETSTQDFPKKAEILSMECDVRCVYVNQTLENIEWLAVVNTVKTLGSIKSGEYFDQLSYVL